MNGAKTSPKKSKSASPATKPTAKVRGREQVEARLIRSACVLLAERGPRAVSIRDIAARAGVNHGQIHHYFGGKRGLLAAAMHHLALEHFEHTIERGLDEFDAPPALTLSQDSEYMMATLRAILDGNMEFAEREIAEGINVPRRVLEKYTKLSGHRKPTLEIKIAAAQAMATELGMAAFGAYIFKLLDIKPREERRAQEALSEKVREPLRNIPVA